MSEPLDEQYLRWLHGQIIPARLRNPSRTYWKLARQLYSSEYVWMVPNDDNRVQDGKDLRREFLADAGIHSVDRDWLELGCSMLEMLLGLSRRLAFEADGEPRDWCLHLLANLGLTAYNDRDYNREAKEHIEEKIYDVIWHRYLPDGRGGLFPLKHAPQDQRRTELWYQAAAYLNENF